MADIYWYGGTDDDITDVANWSDTDSGTGPAAAVPGVTDRAVFNATGVGNAVIAANTTWGRVQVRSIFAHTCTNNVGITLTLAQAGSMSELDDELVNLGTIAVTGVGHIVEPRGNNVELGGTLHFTVDAQLNQDSPSAEFKLTGTVLVEGGTTLTIRSPNGGIIFSGAGTIAQTGTGAATLVEESPGDFVTWDSTATVPSADLAWGTELHINYQDASPVHIADGFTGTEHVHLVHSGDAGSYEIIFDGDFDIGLFSLTLDLNETAGVSTTTTTFSATGAVTAGSIQPTATTVGVLEHTIDLGAGTFDLGGSFLMASGFMNGNTVAIDWGSSEIDIATSLDLSAVSASTSYENATVAMSGTGNVITNGGGDVWPELTLLGSGVISLASTVTNFYGFDGSSFTGDINAASSSKILAIAGPEVLLGTAWQYTNAAAGLEVGFRFIDLGSFSGTRHISVDDLGGSSPLMNFLSFDTTDLTEVEDEIVLYVIEARKTATVGEHLDGGSILFTNAVGTKEFISIASTSPVLSVPIDLNVQTVEADLVADTLTFSQVDNGTLSVGSAPPGAGVVQLAAGYSGTADIDVYGDLKLLGTATVGEYQHLDAAATSDMNGKVLTSTADITVEQGNIAGLASGGFVGDNISFGVAIAPAGAWTVDATISLQAINGVLVMNSDASAGVQGDGTLALDGGGNTNWNFGGGPDPSLSPALVAGLGLGVQSGRTNPEEAM